LADVPGIPSGVTVQAYPCALHQHSEIYPSPGEWLPERWLDSQSQLASSCEGKGESRAEMLRWFWAFGSGGRMCLGSHFATLIMKMMVVAIFNKFDVVAHEGQEHGMRQRDGFPAGPRAGRCDVRFAEMDRDEK
jgi:cytochrome P450